MSETRQLIIFLLCIASLMVSVWTMIDVNHLVFVVEKLAKLEDQP